MTYKRQAEEFRTLLNRLESVIEDEMAALKLGHREKLPHTAMQKERLLVDFARLTSPIEMGPLSSEVSNDGKRILSKLRENARSLSNQIKATGEVIDTISAAIAYSESDGTYERSRGCY